MADGTTEELDGKSQRRALGQRIDQVARALSEDAPTAATSGCGKRLKSSAWSTRSARKDARVRQASPRPTLFPEFVQDQKNNCPRSCFRPNLRRPDGTMLPGQAAWQIAIRRKSVVPKVGLEPARVLPHRILSPARLPYSWYWKHVAVILKGFYYRQLRYFTDACTL